MEIERDGEPVDSYGRDIGPSPLVARGRIVQIGSKPGALDAHVRRGCLVLRCEAGAGYGNDRPIEMTFNDEDAAILAKVFAIVSGQPFSDIQTISEMGVVRTSGRGAVSQWREVNDADR